MKALEVIQCTRDYLDYVERHIKYVKRAWLEVQDKCKSLSIISDDAMFFSLDGEIQHHDLSKLGKQEFVQYRRKFYPTAEEKAEDEADLKDPDAHFDMVCAAMDAESDFQKAWLHHWRENKHHWQNWTKLKLVSHPGEKAMHCAHMVVDWLAMSYELGDTPRSYYEQQKEAMDLPDWAVERIHEMFDLLES